MFKFKPYHPKKLSTAIGHALTDLKKAEKHSKYDVQMAVWHQPDQGKCHVCLAGAVMAFRMNVPRNESASPGTFYDDNETHTKLLTLEHVRSGHWSDAFSCFYKNKEAPDVPDDMPPMPSYSTSPEQFKTALTEVVAILRKAGL